MSSIASTNIKANDGKYHHLVLVTENNCLELYIDGKLEKTVNYTMSGKIPSNYGIFWNNKDTSIFIEGEFKLFRYYNRTLTNDEILLNYNSVKNMEEGN